MSERKQLAQGHYQAAKWLRSCEVRVGPRVTFLLPPPPHTVARVPLCGWVISKEEPSQALTWSEAPPFGKGTSVPLAPPQGDTAEGWGLRLMLAGTPPSANVKRKFT